MTDMITPGSEDESCSAAQSLLRCKTQVADSMGTGMLGLAVVAIILLAIKAGAGKKTSAA